MAPCKYHDICNLEAVETTTEGESFCILHSPSAKKDASRFQDALKNYHVRTLFNYPYIVFPKETGAVRGWFNNHPGHPVIFSNATFLGDANFSELNLGGGGDFKNTVFHGNVNFFNCSIDGPIDFSSAHFKHKVRFSRAKFRRSVAFRDSEFEGEVDFSWDSPSQTLLNQAEFTRAKFLKGASFHNVQFDSGTDFTETEFNGYVDFHDVNFMGETRFHLTRFRSKVSFERANFQGITTFRGDSRESNFLEEVNMEGIRLEKKQTLRFINVNLSTARLSDSNVTNVEFVGVRWRHIGRRLGICDETLVSKDSVSPSLVEVEKTYRQLKQNYEERRDFGRAGDFHIGEKEMQLRNPDTPVGLRLMLSLYKFSNGYGEQIAKPLYCFGFLIAYVTVLGLMGGLFDRSLGRFLDVWIPTDLLGGLLWAFDNAFHLPGEYFLPAASVRWLQTLAGVFGPLFIALFGLAVRNRLKR